MSTFYLLDNHHVRKIELSENPRIASSEGELLAMVVYIRFYARS